MFKKKADNGYVIITKNGKTYEVSLERLLKRSKKGLFNTKKYDSQTFVIFYDEGIENIRFVDCNFDSQKEIKGFRLIINDTIIQNINIDMYDVNFGNRKIYIADALFGGNRLNMHGIKCSIPMHINFHTVNLYRSNNTLSHIMAKKISICNYKVRGDESFDIKAAECIELKNVNIETTDKISINSPKIEYKNVSLTSSDIKIEGLFNTEIAKKDVYTIKDEDLGKLKLINKFHSCIKGVDNNINELIKKEVQEQELEIDAIHNEKIKEIEKEIDLIYNEEMKEKEIDSIHDEKIKELKSSISYLNTLKTLMLHDTKWNGLGEKVSVYCKKNTK